MNRPDLAVSAILTGALNSLWIAVALAAATWLFTRCLPRTNAATRHLLWWAVLVLVVLLPFRSLERAAAPRRRVAPLTMTPVRAAVVPDAPSAYAPVPAPASSAFPVRMSPRRWVLPLVAAWLIFFLSQCARIAWSFLHLRGIKRRTRPAPEPLQRVFQDWVAHCGTRRPVRLAISREIASPLAAGFLQPAVILPESLLDRLQDRDLDHILLHELAHVARRDDWSNLAARALGALAGLNPVAAWAQRQVARERELATDDWVVAMTGEARPYAASLARMFELCGTRHRQVLATGMATSASHLGERIEILLRRGRQFTPRASLTRVAAAAALLLAIAAGAHAPNWVVLAQPSAPAPAPVAAPTVNPHGSFLAALVAAGYKDLPVDDIIAIKEHGITAGYLAGVSQSGWGRMKPGEMIELHDKGVQPQYLRDIHGAGFRNLAIQDVIEMHQHSVRPADIAAIHSLGYGPYTPAQAIDLASHGVSPQFFHAAHEAGIARIEVPEAIDAAARGVGAASFRAAGDYGSHLTLQQIVKLRQAGVIP